jgi:C-terminal processing protease CtpA/Prc
MGVSLEGKGTVVSIEPGSAAERAGIQVGDRINRINGR